VGIYKFLFVWRISPDIEKIAMGGTWSMYGGEKMSTQGVGGET